MAKAEKVALNWVQFDVTKLTPESATVIATWKKAEDAANEARAVATRYFLPKFIKAGKVDGVMGKDKDGRPKHINCTKTVRLGMRWSVPSFAYADVKAKGASAKAIDLDGYLAAVEAPKEDQL